MNESSKWIMNRRTDVSLICLLPVDFGCEIITMVNEDPGSQLLFIPDYSLSPLFWHRKPWMNVESPTLCSIGDSLYKPQSPRPFPSPFSLPALFPPLLPAARDKGGAEQVAFQTSHSHSSHRSSATICFMKWPFGCHLLLRVPLWNSWNPHDLRCSPSLAPSSDRGEAVALKLPVFYPLYKRV